MIRGFLVWRISCKRC